MGLRFTTAIAAASTCLLLGTAGVGQAAGIPVSVTYLGNEGVMIEQGETRILVDPLFRLQNAYYQAVPDHIENALVTAEPPFDGVDAVMVTHYHLDHFSPNLMLNYLTLNPEVRLYAPEQAVQGLTQFSAGQEEAFLERVTGLNLSHYGNPFSQKTGELEVEVLRIPHSGWPEQNRGVQNLVYRITLADGTSVLHLGDAEAQFELFARFRDFWLARDNDLVLAPFWYLQSGQGQRILNELLRARDVVGLHVPTGVPENPQARPEEYRNLKLMVTPGTKYVLSPAR